MNKLMSTIIALLCLAATAAATEQSLRPGGIAIVDIGAADAAVPVATYRNKSVLVMRREDRWVAVVGIPLNTEPGTLRLVVDGNESAVEISKHAYREQHLTLKNKSYVTPNSQQLERIGRERKIINAALTNFRTVPIDGVSLAAPVTGPQSSSFGLRRFFNEQPRSPHKGMDIAAGNGEPITAPRSGVVTAIGNYFFNGNTVIVDHGQGFVTLYCHMSEISVEPDQLVAVGDLLGAVGSTGRVTGPHLHFGTYLNGTAVDPAIFITYDNSQKTNK